MPNRLVAVGESTKFGYSDDGGLTWGGASSSPGAGNYWDITHDGDYFIAVGDHLIGRSVDGINWTSDFPAVDPFTGVIRCIEWVEDLGLYIVGTSDGKIYTTADIGSEVWTERYSFGSANIIYDLTYSPTLGRLVGGMDDGGFIHSTDGITWTYVSVPVGTGYAARTVEWVDFLGIFIAGLNTGRTRWSVDGLTWTLTAAIASIAASGDCLDLAVDSVNNQVVMIGGGPAGAYSSDGFAWTTATMPASFGPIYDIGNAHHGACYYHEESGLYVLLDGGDGDIGSSTDGQTFTMISNVATTGWNAVTDQYVPTTAGSLATWIIG